MKQGRQAKKDSLAAPVSLFLAILLLLPSCGKEISAYDCMSDFSAVYGGGGTVFSPTVQEGESGYIGKDFFTTLFGEGYSEPENYAVCLMPSPDCVGECGIFVCESRARQSEAVEFCEHRLVLLHSFGFADDRAVQGAKIFCVNRCVIYYALSDGARAEKILRSLI